MTEWCSRGWGTGMAAAFGSARDAVATAVAAQQALAIERWPERLGALRGGMGVHTGEAVVVDGHYLNQPLNRCARLMAIGHGGQVLVSGTTEPLVRGGLPDDVELVDVGHHRLRDVAEAVRVFQVCGPGLERDFGPLRSLDVFPGNLPVQVTSFVGRDHELAELVRMLSDHRLVTLTGVGGVGKTRLALQVAGDVLVRFQDGAWLCELAAAGDAEAMVELIAATLGVRQRPGVTRVESILEYLRPKELLVVVDNCEHVLDAAGRLIDELLHECPSVRVRCDQP